MNTHLTKAEIDKLSCPPSIKVCKCEQCRYVKNKRKNRKQKKIVKRIINRMRRNNNLSGKRYTYYWA